MGANMMRVSLFLWGCTLSAALYAAPVKVEVVPEGGLKRGGEPYFIQGAGGDGPLKLLKTRGGNSLRTWGHEGLGAKLDEADALGLTVAAGIWLEPECSWFSYSRPEHCDRQAARVKQIVTEHKDHPALLLWGLGNEMEGDGGNAALWKQVNRLAKLVHETDSAHPTFTALAGISDLKAKGLNEHAPDLDLVGINTYGALPGLRETLAKLGWKRPWVVTEYGPRGFWEVGKTSWGAPLEDTSTQKAEFLKMAATKALGPGATEGCAGGYAFLWGQKQEASATWFGLLTEDGAATPSVDVLQELWSGKKPANRAPAVDPLRCDQAGQTLRPGQKFSAGMVAQDPDGDALTFDWRVLSAHGARDKEGRELTPPAHPAALLEVKGSNASFAAPSQPGEYRIYGYARDGHGGVGTANFVVRVSQP